MSRAAGHNGALPADLVERVLAKLGLGRRPACDLDGLHAIYAVWCGSVPFDNVRKLIHLRAGDTGPFPGSDPADFFQAWLKHGTGGTCWAGAGAMHALLSALGFEAARGIATMMVVPDLPPNHGTVRVTLGDEHYLVDSSILHGKPLRLEGNGETTIEHPAWGVRCTQRDGRSHIWWRALHMPNGFECRLEHFNADAADHAQRYEQTRPWSPFNYEVCARLNRGGQAVGVGFGRAVTFQSDGGVAAVPVTHAERKQLLIEQIGMSEEIVDQLPQDIPTPPPPWSQTAQAQGA